MILLTVFAICIALNWYLARQHEAAGNRRWSAWCWANVGWCLFGFFDRLCEILDRGI